MKNILLVRLYDHNKLGVPEVVLCYSHSCYSSSCVIPKKDGINLSDENGRSILKILHVVHFPKTHHNMDNCWQLSITSYAGLFVSQNHQLL